MIYIYLNKNKAIQAGTSVIRTALPILDQSPRWSEAGCPPFPEIVVNIFNLITTSEKDRNGMYRLFNGNHNGWGVIYSDLVDQVIELFEASGVEFTIMKYYDHVVMKDGTIKKEVDQ